MSQERPMKIEEWKKSLDDARPRAGLPLPDDVHIRTPVDRVAARVVGAGEHYELSNNTDEVCRPVPLPTRPVPPRMPNYCGVTFGRLTVVALASIENNASYLKMDPLRRQETKRQQPTARWLCRCACGMYTLRSSKTVRLAPDEAMCFQCNRQKHLQWIRDNQKILEAGKQK